MKGFEKVLEHEIVNYGIRLVPKNTDPTSEYWFDYKIEPLVSKPIKTYYAYVVYRDVKDKKDTVIRIAEQIEDTVKSLVKCMEE